MKRRTHIRNLEKDGFVLSDAQLPKVAGGAAPAHGKCWQQSTCMAPRGEPDPARDWVTD